MKAFNTYKNLFFIGIGGIGMSALARFFNSKNFRVYGYDKTESDLTSQLQNEGISIQFHEAISAELESELQPEQTLVVYTPAVNVNSDIFQYFKNGDFQILKRAVVLGKITENLPTLAVAGTHGKTTTSAILAHILKENGIKLTAFCGGILQNYDTNFISDGEEVVVIEADEFDRSFLQLHPSAAVITSLDADHLDIYGDDQTMRSAFQEFINLVPNSHLFKQKALQIEGKSIAVGEQAEFYIENIKVENGHYVFDFVSKEHHLKNIKFDLPGKHNLFNAAAALTLAIDFKPELAQDFAKALSSFKGVKRRFNYILKTEDLVVIDDYAHHPSEISAVHQAVSEMHPNKTQIVIFQPHLFSRTRDFADDFATSLASFDEVNLLEIYPARELPIDGINAAFLLKKINNSNKKVIEKKEIKQIIDTSQNAVVVLLGAGDIGVEAHKISKYFNETV
ncbi:UDP-N-acetylmuramate--L-alanine ligase [Psychroflexus aestuariivivens]|uniref:UDP-N-acetylmuramate--L-alanine ligase n=1 Tax=Psychroflexus aestuariivivens TaxID=1795040 RepID=UPI000FDA6E4A|nr:UDP-N-acetylmuramate--L-alanine ligase [Psychroflexus aestuariivivens]